MTLDEMISDLDYVVHKSQMATLELGDEGARQLLRWMEDYKKLKEATRWIPCSERMPEEHEDVLVAMKSGKYKYIHIGYAYNSGDWMIDGEFWYEEGDPSITHWTPLPEMPKGDAE